MGSEADNRFDILTNKHVKYLFYYINDCLQSWDIKTKKIRHMKTFEEFIALEEVLERNW